MGRRPRPLGLKGGVELLPVALNPALPPMLEGLCWALATVRMSGAVSVGLRLVPLGEAEVDLSEDGRGLPISLLSYLLYTTPPAIAATAAIAAQTKMIAMVDEVLNRLSKMGTLILDSTPSPPGDELSEETMRFIRIKSPSSSSMAVSVEKGSPSVQAVQS